MTSRTVTAMFNSREQAEQAGQALMSELGLDRGKIRTSPAAGMTDTGYDAKRPYEEKGFFASIKDLLVPDEDRYAYAEGMRRGSVLLSATLDDNQVDRASDVLEHHGALDLDEQEASWRKSGWTGYDSAAHNTARSSATPASMGSTPAATATAPTAPGVSGTAAPAAGVRPGQDETIKVMQERLLVGKRQVEGGRVKVRSYVIERPVEEQVTLHQESLHVDRHPVDRAATAADMAAFQERTIEARATSEEAVVSKEARVVEEIALHKQASDRTETVRDTVRETKVDVDDTTGARAAGGATPAQRGSAAAATSNTTPGTGTATGAAGKVDRTLNTNTSGTNPAADAPDGTPGNPSGTMASRAVDKTLGTNISGANPTRK